MFRRNATPTAAEAAEAAEAVDAATLMALYEEYTQHIDQRSLLTGMFSDIRDSAWDRFDFSSLLAENEMLQKELGTFLGPQVSHRTSCALRQLAQTRKTIHETHSTICTLKSIVTSSLHQMAAPCRLDRESEMCVEYARMLTSRYAGSQPGLQSSSAEAAWRSDYAEPYMRDTTRSSQITHGVQSAQTMRPLQSRASSSRTAGAAWSSDYARAPWQGPWQQTGSQSSRPYDDRVQSRDTRNWASESSRSSSSSDYVSAPWRHYERQSPTSYGAVNAYDVMMSVPEEAPGMAAFPLIPEEADQFLFQNMHPDSMEEQEAVLEESDTEAVDVGRRRSRGRNQNGSTRAARRKRRQREEAALARLADA